MSEANSLSSLPASFQRFSLKFEEMSKSYDYLVRTKENACFINYQSSSACQKQTRQNSPTSFFYRKVSRSHSDVNRVPRSSPTGNEIRCALYTQNFYFILMNIPS